jgi:hypothetical protein
MRFEFYSDAIANVPKLSVDGTVDNAIHFSHWKGNETPASLKADTSTEIALNLVAAANREDLTQGIDLVTNNHFDTDGVLSVWSVLNGERSLALRERLIAAAEAGDFSEFSSADGVRASIAIQGSDSPIDKSGSPLAQHLAGEDFNDEARAYEVVLPHVADIIEHPNKYEALWREPWARIESALDSFAKGTSRVEEIAGPRLSLVHLASESFGPEGFNPALHAAPFAAISKHARGDLFLIATPLNDGWAYRIDYPYYSWAETIVRPRIKRSDFTAVVAALNESDPGKAGQWRVDESELASAMKFLDANNRLAGSRLRPDEVAGQLVRALTESRAAEARHA